MEIGPVGKVVGGRYECVSLIGRGGMGEVWRARDTLLHREVAVKRLTYTDVGGDGSSTARTMREARLAARLNHPHAVAIYDVVMDEGLPCLVMELVEGRSLKEFTAEQGLLTPAVAARIGRQVAGALAAAHRVGIVHRDVKPANVLIDPEGTAKLTDFGIAREENDTGMTATGTFIGTPSYLSPEVAMGGPNRPASDIWALGATLYAAIEGEAPFGSGGNALAILSRIANSPAPVPLHAGPMTAPIMAMLHREPGARPSAADVTDMLDTVLAGATATTSTAPQVRSWPAVYSGPPTSGPPVSGPPVSGPPPTGGYTPPPTGGYTPPPAYPPPPATAAPHPSGPYPLLSTSPAPGKRGSSHTTLLLVLAAVAVAAVVAGLVWGLSSSSSSDQGQRGSSSPAPTSPVPSTSPPRSTPSTPATSPTTVASSGDASCAGAGNDGFGPAVSYIISLAFGDVKDAQACVKPGSVAESTTRSLSGRSFNPSFVDETGGEGKGHTARYTFQATDGGKSVVVTTSKGSDGNYLVTKVTLA